MQVAMIAASYRYLKLTSNIKLPKYRAISGLVTTFLDDGVFYVGLNSPEKRNAVGLETASQLFDAFHRFNEDKDALVAILHGHGGTFCAGFDLKQLGNLQVKNIDEIDRLFEGRAPMVNTPML